MPTHLHSIGYSLASAAAITSGFWLALAIGRFAVAPFVLRLGEAVVVLLTTGASIVTLLLAILAPFAAVAYIVTGLIIAPIFPTGVAWLARLNPKNPAATSWLFPAGMVGGALIPTFAGVLVQGISPAVVPGFFAVVALTTLVSFSGAGFSSRRPRAATAGVPG
jgi:fucose permease